MNSLFARLVKLNPSYQDIEVVNQPHSSIRDKYPFVKDINCVYELKLIFSDYVTTHYNIINLRKLAESTANLDDLYNICNSIVTDWEINRICKAELDHYLKNKRTLGKHPIWAENEQRSNYATMSLRELISTKNRMEHNIWRINHEIDRKDKPHLYDDRIMRLNEKKRLLSYIDNIIERRNEVF